MVYDQMIHYYIELLYLHIPFATSADPQSDTVGKPLDIWIFLRKFALQNI